MKTRTVIREADLQAAFDGSWFTILGAGGDLQEWVDGMERYMKHGLIGTPTAWFKTTGAEVNEFMGVREGPHAFQDDLVMLLVPIDGLHVGRLAILKIEMNARWFDDIVDNARAASRDE